MSFLALLHLCHLAMRCLHHFGTEFSGAALLLSIIEGGRGRCVGEIKVRRVDRCIGVWLCKYCICLDCIC